VRAAFARASGKDGTALGTQPNVNGDQ